MHLSTARTVVGAAVTALTVGALAVPATATPSGDNLVISEVYGGGGNSGAPLRSDFIELYNPTDAAISLDGLTVQYRSASGGSGGAPAALNGTVAPGGYYLIKAADGSNTAAPALPAPDAETTFAMSGTNGQVLLIKGTSFTGSGDVAGNAQLVDAVGYGNANTFEAAATLALTNSTSASRNDAGADTDNNRADFSTGAPTPRNSGGPVDPPADPDPVEATIAEIQSTGPSSPMVGKIATTKGVVTARYPIGGYNGFYIQTGGTGGAEDATPGASDGLFIFAPDFDETSLKLGDSVQVTGEVSEYQGLTEITASKVEFLAESLPAVKPLETAYPTTESEREAHEGELLAPTDDFTVTDVYDINSYASIGLATGTTPLVQPTEVQDAQTGDIAGVKADNERRAVVLDDGASANYLTGVYRHLALPWLSNDNPIRIGAAVQLKQPVILEFRNDVWTFQPTEPVTDLGRDVAEFENTRVQNLKPRETGGDLKIGTFNVNNYFNTTGKDWVAAGNQCQYYTDREGNPVTNRDCGPTGPRGAAEDEDEQRQAKKIVTAINLMETDIVSLEEIENSVKLGEDRDDALADLTTALNDAAGSDRWAFVPSPPASELPPVEEQDVIRTAFIYNPKKIALVGQSDVLTGSAAFGNAREPLAQAFKQKGVSNAKPFSIIVNHFKSKGSGVDDGTGQGNANPDRIAQAKDLITFADEFAAARGTDAMFLAGDFNSYSQEDPMQELYSAGYQKIESDEANDDSYSFAGLSGSLDHVLANDAAAKRVTGADMWEINADESVAFAYSRYNYNLTNFFDPNTPFAASDHNPKVIGLAGDVQEAKADLRVAVIPRKIHANKTRARVIVKVTSNGQRVRSGSIVVLDAGRELAAKPVRRGIEVLKLPRFKKPGTYPLTVRYIATNGAQTDRTVTVKVVKHGTPRR